MNCICRPWNGYHLDACPCQAAYQRSREAELEADPTSDEDAAAFAAQLVADGWVQQSRKYRRVIRVPYGVSAIEELERLNPAAAEQTRLAAAMFIENQARAQLYRYAETRELSYKVFAAFRKLQ